MRILHFYKDYLPESMGGVEQVIRQLCAGTGRLGVHNEVLTLTRQAQAGDVDFEGVRVRRVPCDLEIASNGMSLAAIGELRRMAAGCDVVHYHFPWPFADLAHFAARIRKPAVLTYHSDIVRQKLLLRFYQPLCRRFLHSVDAIVASSPNYLASSAVLARYRHKTRVIAYGLDKSIYPAPGEERLRHWRARFKGRFFLFVGVLRYYKGLHILLEAMAGADYPVVIVGAGPIEQELKAHAARLGLGNVHFAGAVGEDDKVALLTLCHALVFPSHLRSEAFGISLLEGAMFGKPMVSSEIGTGTSYINIDGQTGLVVPAGDPRAFRQAMHALWSDPACAAHMGRCAAARYAALFTAQQMAASYTSLYDELMARRAGVPQARARFLHG
jgi:glycosyltransferase involved in cell wall biosynthesis